jgi:asparagine synthase (glutamine-hydrolysing)
MCGIAGIVGDNAGHAEQMLAPMLADMKRRGPDAQGLESWGGATLGHRRLSIFDLSDCGRQPMLSPDRRIGVVFNGAIYNFRSLRAELETFGYRFRSQTDTEVLIHGYAQWGIDRLTERLRGMFAFGLWDERTGKLFLVRDRLGVKPLIYSVAGDRIGFASTVRALRAAGFGGDIDSQAVVEFLEYGFVSDNRSIYEEISKVPAAHILEWSDGRISMRRYWQRPAPAAPAEGLGFEEAVERAEELLLEATRLRLDADVPVGSLLSGGVDSSLICWAVAHHGADITAFTVGTPGNVVDETGDAVATARKLGIRHQIIPLSPDDAPPVSELVSAYGEPFACSSALGMLSVSKAVKNSATVLLTGDGGDDVFLGYPVHNHLWQAQRMAQRIPARVARVWRGVRPAIAGIRALKRPAHFLDYITGGLGGVTQAHDGLPFYLRKGMLGERLAGARLPEREIPWSAEGGRRVLDDYLEYEHNYRFRCEYLTKVDGGAMHYALEARSPFLDQEVWTFAAALPYDVRLRNGQLKAVLRELARRRVGERVATGAKRGFSIPVLDWIPGKWRPAIEESFRSSRLAEGGWMRQEGLITALQRAGSAGRATNHLWYAYVLESWLRSQYMEARSDVGAVVRQG